MYWWAKQNVASAQNKIQEAAGAASGGMDSTSYKYSVECRPQPPSARSERQLERRLELEPRLLRERLERQQCLPLLLQLIWFLSRFI